ncbi:MAG: VOC family protein [Acidimicrobiia bacterium]|nr:VOC family protein [Acidimicrobiia bacterium]
MTNAAIDTIIVQAADPSALADFYVRALSIDADEVVEEDGHYGFDLGEIYLGFDRSDGSHQHPGPISFWLTVDDLDATFHRCIEEGATAVLEPVDRPWGDRLASVKDPEGNVVGFSLRRE